MKAALDVTPAPRACHSRERGARQRESTGQSQQRSLWLDSRSVLRLAGMTGPGPGLCIRSPAETRMGPGLFPERAIARSRRRDDANDPRQRPYGLSRQRQDHAAGAAAAASAVRAHGGDHQRVRRGRPRPRPRRDQRGELRHAPDGMPVLRGARRPSADARGYPAAARCGGGDAVRARGDRDQRAGRPRTHPACADDRQRPRATACNRGRGGHGRCCQRPRHAGTAARVPEAGGGRRPPAAHQDRSRRQRRGGGAGRDACPRSIQAQRS